MAIMGLVALCGAVGCNDAAAIRADAPRVLDAGASTAHPATTPTVAIPEDFALSFERTHCYGTCPAYEVTVQRSGQVHFAGERGCTDSELTHDQMQELVELLEMSGFVDLKDATQESVTDLPSTIVTVRMYGQKKRLKHYLGAGNVDRNEAVRFRALEEGIDFTTGANLLPRSAVLAACPEMKRFE